MTDVEVADEARRMNWRQSDRGLPHGRVRDLQADLWRARDSVEHRTGDIADGCLSVIRLILHPLW